MSTRKHGTERVRGYIRDGECVMRQTEKLIATAKSYVGYLEKASDSRLEDFTANAGSGNYTIFGEWYDEYFGVSGFNGAAWCHEFVSYCACIYDIGSDIIPYTASCGTGVRWFMAAGRWYARDGYTPVAGDIYITRTTARHRRTWEL